jgi:hypothetical protein
MRRFLMSVLGVVLGTSTLAATQAAAEPPGSSASHARGESRLVTFAASSTDRVGGQRLVFRGRARTERGVKRLVQLHARVRGEWDVVAHTRTDRRGRYRFVVTSPNPAAAPVSLTFRVESVGTANRKLRAAWRKHSRSTSTRVTFRNNPALAQPSYALADPAACESGTPGVMARTAACVAAVEAQLVERLWLDVRRIDAAESDTDLMLQLGVQLQALAGPDLGLAYVQLLLPHTSAALLESDLAGDGYQELLLAFFLTGYAVQEELESFDPTARRATTWKPAWTEHFIVEDLSRVVVSGDTATTPKRSFGEGDSLTLGGPWTYASGRWYAAPGRDTFVERLS